MFEYLIAFGAGLISFLSPCVLPLIPGYISYISGQSLQEILNQRKINIFPLILFCLGFSTVFVILGASASFLGKVLLQISQSFRLIAGLVIIFFSFQLLGVFNFGFLNMDKRFDFKKFDSFFFPVVIGFAFGFGWTPCIGPVLGSILALSATEASVSSGVLLLSFYSLGLAIPFILSGYYMSKFLTTRKGFSKYYGRVTKTGGVILLLTGVLIATNQIQVISFYILTIFPFLTTLG